MTATISIDSAGRVVLPKAIRDRLCLRAGTKLKAEVIADRVELTPLADEEVKLVRKGKRLVLARTGKSPDAAAAIRAEHDYLETVGRRR